MEQVQALARWLATCDLGKAHIYSSDMMRARQTAQAIARELGTTVEYTAKLREMNLGEWQGLTHDEVEARWPGELAARHLDIENHAAPGGESGADIRKRIFDFYTGLLDKHRGETIILISHGGSLAVLRSAIHNWNLNEAWVANRTRLPNTGVTVLRYLHASGSHDLEYSASLAHLEGEEAQTGDTE
jgi:broad specificity phosphatase PhoE